jgi:hypothetical protein
VADLNRLEEAERLVDQFASLNRQQMLQTPHDERTFVLNLASTLALVDIASSLRAMRLSGSFK